jgi:invasion protein IalB
MAVCSKPTVRRGPPARTASGMAAALLTAGAAFAQGANTVGTYGNWSLNATPGDADKTCFAAASPTQKEPAGANRAPVVFYVSAWPKDGVKSEISVKLGYKIKAGSEIVLTVGTATYKLFAKDDRAFIGDATQELKLLEAMKKASKLQVQATSERGTATTDTYSLGGLTQALQALAQNCR